MEGEAHGPEGIAEGFIQCTMAEAPACFPLLELPDECLLAVLRCHAQEDPRSLFSAARAHSRLHQAAVLALDSIMCRFSEHQQEEARDSVLLYLSRHAQHINSVEMEDLSDQYDPTLVVQLPAGLQLRSLCLDSLELQLLAGSSGGCSVLDTVSSHLSKLTLQGCVLLDADAPASLAAGLQQLPELQHLSLSSLVDTSEQELSLPAGMLQQLHGLTFLELLDAEIRPQMLQHLQLLTKLRDLRLEVPDGCSITAAMLAGMQQLTSLRLCAVSSEDEEDEAVTFEPGVLASKPLLQHLSLNALAIPDGPAGVADLLAGVQQLTQLTHLELPVSLRPAAPLAAAYAALTASSALQHLDLACCVLPAGVWQHMMPPGKQLPQLRHLKLDYVVGLVFRAADVSRLTSCCPSLQQLTMPPLEGEPAQLLAPLRGLTGLQALRVFGLNIDDAGLHVLAQLTGLTGLHGSVAREATVSNLMQLTSLRQLRQMYLSNRFEFEAAGEPVWCKLLQWCIIQGVPGAASLQPSTFEEGLEG